MFKTTDLTVGDLVATLSGTVVSVKALPAKVHGVQLIALTVHDWNDDLDHSYNVLATSEFEVWE